MYLQALDERSAAALYDAATEALVRIQLASRPNAARDTASCCCASCGLSGLVIAKQLGVPFRRSIDALAGPSS